MSHVSIRTGVFNGRKASAYASYLPAIANPAHFDFAETTDARNVIGGSCHKILAKRETDGAKVMLKKCEWDTCGFAEVAIYRIAHRLRFQANETQYLSPADCSAIGLNWEFGGTIHTWEHSYLSAETLKREHSLVSKKDQEAFDRMQLALIWLDTLVHNEDRHIENYGAINYDGNLTLFAIDHAYADINQRFRSIDLMENLERAEFFFNTFKYVKEEDFLTAIQFRNTRFAQARRVLDILCNFWTAEDWDSIFCDMPDSFKPFLKPLMERHICLVERYKKYLRIG